ncbi:MAG: hypothetical protein LVQ96_04395 [Thermoplasmatales archaeon]|nr:hypothetical protein [Thermoplasmatales archaeon]MCW6170394.1 hypothetical protein [Thermoplasmatales archaeon]
MDKNNGTVKISISISPELNRAAESMCVKTGLSKSRLIESILRENKDINRFIQAQRSEKGGFFTGKVGDSYKRNMKKVETIKS